MPTTVISPQEFAHQITERQAAVSAPVEEYVLSTKFSELAIRRQGSFTLRAVLANPRTLEPVDVFYCEPDATVPKLTAAHPMMPVGPHNGPGGRHGWPRWADYDPVAEYRPGSRILPPLRAQIPKQVGRLLRQFTLQPFAMEALTGVITPPGSGMTKTSLGHHDYYSLRDEGDGEGLTINGQSIDQLLGGGSTRAIMDGETRFWSRFWERAEVGFPDGRQLRISARAHSWWSHRDHPISEPVGILLWHRPGTPSFCIEPTVGVYGKAAEDLKMDELSLRQTGSARLQVVTEVV